MPFASIARCADATFDVGHTDDLSAREDAHNAGHGARYTADRRPIRIVYSEQFDSMEAAIGRERQLKGWTTTKKAALVSNEASRLKGISKRSRIKRG